MLHALEEIARGNRAGREASLHLEGMASPPRARLALSCFVNDQAACQRTVPNELARSSFAGWPAISRPGRGVPAEGSIGLTSALVRAGKGPFFRPDLLTVTLAVYPEDDSGKGAEVKVGKATLRVEE